MLIAQPQRVKTNPRFVQRSRELVNGLTYEPRVYVVHLNNEHCRAGEPKYAPHARARNGLVEQNIIGGDYSHVLWLDVDIVTAPADLIERLAAVSMTDVVAPMVFVERLDPEQPPSKANGGWFYDIGGFVHEGQWTNMWAPQWLYATDVVELDSVGSCYLIPADVYCEGLRYSAHGRRVEHESFMAKVRESGRRVLVDTTTTVEHAFLPRFGEGWK